MSQKDIHTTDEQTSEDSGGAAATLITSGIVATLGGIISTLGIYVVGAVLAVIVAFALFWVAYAIYAGITADVTETDEGEDE